MTKFEPALFVLGGLIVAAVVLMTPWEVLWRRATSRIAVEVVRLRTRREGKHTEARLDMQWADDLALPYERTFLPRLSTMSGPPWETSPPLRALPPVPDRLDAMIREFEAASDLPGPHHDDRGAAAGAGRVGEPTPGQAMNLWQPNDVIPPRIAATLARAQADQTVIDTSHATLEPYIVGLAGGDPFDGLGQDAWLDRLFAGAR